MERRKRFLIMAAAFCLAVMTAAASYAEVTPLGPDLTVHGQPLQKDGWNAENTVYQDGSIRAELFEDSVKPASNKTKIPVFYAVVEITDPSQLRTTLSYESFENQGLAKAQDMAKMVNAVVAISDDHSKFNRYRGYVMRQGVFYQDTLEKLSKPQDVLIIDDGGDFHIVTKASTESMEEQIASLAAEGRKPVNIFTFGPALVIDGVGQECKYEDSIHETHLPAARTVIGQLGPLKYFVMSIHGVNSKHYGMNAADMVEYILQRFPECVCAYNLDGGNSSKMVWHGRLKSEPSGGRQSISGLIYFASAATEENP